ncbi:DUF3027 domain-containing protein [Bifidobacterium parmae]|uniref:DUF3027 domain-containing protein n=1 Tax=Bifidobacterium parmae TaxID=361854 RepID=A0A2N5J496_9BIFI|nr:DUF3027 domain-containing protein [Bifidobacterium parmae]PLS29028.1 hypothetical protein Uis4E_0965 [Bifidobacterium parmae]
MTDTTQTPEQDVTTPDVPDAPRIDPRELARSVAMSVAEEPEQVGDVVETHELGDGVTDFRIAAHVKGYEGWQWSVTLYHDEELDRWTVNESSLIPTDDALMPPPWIPWKDRLEPTDLAPTDSIGTDPDDPRLEDGFRRTEPAKDAGEGAEGAVAAADADGDDTDATAEGSGSADDGDGDAAATGADSREDVDEAVEEFDLSRRHVLSPLGRAQTAKRWYEGPRGPKAMSTKTASGHLCSTCGFFVPLKGELNLLFGVCANKWSPDDGRVVSLDHGCGEHSEIEPPEPSRLWVQSKPAYDDLHIDIIAQKPREERAQVEILEQEEPVDQDEPTEQDIEENTEIDADAPEIEENTVDAGDGPEVETVVALDADGSIDTGDADETDETDSADDAVDTDNADNADDAGDAPETDDPSAQGTDGSEDAAE